MNWGVLSVERTAVELLGYGMSWVELLGTLFSLASVWLVARKSRWTWPVGNVGVALFFALFIQIRLYADAIEQVYFFVAGIYGWWAWSARGLDRGRSGFAYGPWRERLLAGAVTGALTLGLGLLIQRLPLWWPSLFSAPPDYPWLDAGTTALSVVATVLMAWGRTECWAYWVVVDVIGIGLYGAKGVHLLALLYVLFLGMAIRGWVEWHKGQVS